MKQITITVPDNCELKQDGNTYTIVEKEEKLTYNEVAKELFSQKGFYICADGLINSFNGYLDTNIIDGTNCTSKKQAEKLLAINKLMNVAKYLNGDWQPDWNNKQELKYDICLDYVTNSLYFDYVMLFNYTNIYFKSEELAQKAIEILGEETIKLALCTDY